MLFKAEVGVKGDAEELKRQLKPSIVDAIYSALNL